MKTKTIILTLGTVLLLVLVVVSLIPISSPTLEDSQITTGKVELVAEEGGPFDIQFHLDNDDRIYYVNRGAENGLDAYELNKALAGNEIEVHYANHWTPLDPFGKMKHITRISQGGTIIYDEIIKQEIFASQK